MIKDGAELIRDAQDVLLMIGKDEDYSPDVTDLPFMASDQRAHDQLSVTDLILLDALPVKGWTDVDHLTEVGGLSVGAVLGGLTRLQLQGLAITRDGQWKKVVPEKS
jgi:DNA processing protein